MKTQIKTARIFILEKMSDFGLFLNSANGFKFLIVSVFLFTFSFYLFTFTGCGKNSTSPQTVTFSGKVTLEGETDHSGVKVSLYKPVPLDTALVRINRQYPQIGVQISQETEFDHQEHTPAYSTLTDAAGNWKIENVVQGEYNVVAEKDGFGWKIVYQAANTKLQINLNKVLVLNQIMPTQSTLDIPSGTYALVTDNLVINENIVLSIGAGAVLELTNNCELRIEGELNLMGTPFKRINVKGAGDGNSRIQLGNNSKATIQNVNFLGLNNTIYLKGAQSVTFKNCRFKKGVNALESLQTVNLRIENCIISEVENGLLLNFTHSELNKNVFYKIAQNGILSLNEKSSIWKNNIFTYCLKNGLSMNPEGYAYTSSWANIYQNDFIKNYNHIQLGSHGWCTATLNNFLNETNYILLTSAKIGIDSLNFKANYWNYLDPNMISDKILDGYDRIGQPSVGCFVNFSDYRKNYIQWQ